MVPHNLAEAHDRCRELGNVTDEAEAEDDPFNRSRS